MATKCPKCESEIKDENVFCTNCGERLRGYSTIRYTQKNYIGVATNREEAKKEHREYKEYKEPKPKDPLIVNRSIASKTGIMLLVVDALLLLAAVYNIISSVLVVLGTIKIEEDLALTLSYISFGISCIPLLLSVFAITLRKNYKVNILFTLASFPFVIVGGHFLFIPLSIFSGIIMTFVLFFAIPTSVINGKANAFIKNQKVKNLDKSILRTSNKN